MDSSLRVIQHLGIIHHASAKLGQPIPQMQSAGTVRHVMITPRAMLGEEEKEAEHVLGIGREADEPIHPLVAAAPAELWNAQYEIGQPVVLAAAKDRSPLFHGFSRTDLARDPGA